MNEEKSKKYQSLLNDQKRILESLLQIPVNIHYAPRYLHSVGQLHKGGKTGNHFIFIDNIKMNKAKIPNYNFSFSDIAAAQLRNDSEYLTKISKKVAITKIKDLQTITGTRSKLYVTTRSNVIGSCISVYYS